MAQELILGFLVGVCSRLVTAPLGIITTRMQTDREEASDARDESNLATTIKNIYAERGLLGFWKGFDTTVLLSLNPALTFTFLHMIRRAASFHRRHSSRAFKATPFGPLESFLTGAFANAAATWILYPLILAKTRLQAPCKRLPPLPKHTNETTVGAPPTHYQHTLISTLRDAYSGESGYPNGLYQGLSAQLIKSIINMGVTVMVKERSEVALVSAIQQWRKYEHVRA